MFISLVVSMNSRQGFDHGSCVVTVFEWRVLLSFVRVGQWKGEGGVRGA